MTYEKKLKELKRKMKKNLATDPEIRMYKHLTRISGMKGAEKKQKDRIGKSLNFNDRITKVVDRARERIDKNSYNEE